MPGRLFTRGSWPETVRIARLLRRETVGGMVLPAAAAAALIWAGSPVSASYPALRDLRVGPAALHLDPALGAWAGDVLLAVFFFVAGLELEREFVACDLRAPWRAALPVATALGGMAVPAALQGWAVPTATGAGTCTRESTSSPPPRPVCMVRCSRRVPRDTPTSASTAGR